MSIAGIVAIATGAERGVEGATALRMAQVVSRVIFVGNRASVEQVSYQ
jgi:hypothetical protein